MRTKRAERLGQVNKCGREVVVLVLIDPRPAANIISTVPPLARKPHWRSGKRPCYVL